MTNVFGTVIVSLAKHFAIGVVDSFPYLGSLGMTKQIRQPFLHTTPAGAIRKTVQEVVSIQDRSFIIERPHSIDDVLDHPDTMVAFEQDEYMPYWADLWPSAEMLAAAILEHSWSEPHELTALEIGCGVGLPSLAALSVGMHVTMTDYDHTAVQFALRNAMANGFQNVAGHALDWRHLSDEPRVHVLLAADVLYERRNIEPIVNLIDQLLLPLGECWLTDPNRAHANEFQQQLIRRGLCFERTNVIRPAGNSNSPAPVVHGSLYRIRHKLTS